MLIAFRLNVIRSLYFVYDPFVVRMKAKMKEMGDPHHLKGCICLGWNLRRHASGRGWYFCFLFEKRSSKTNPTPVPANITTDNFVRESWEEVDENERVTEVCLAISVGQSLSMKFIPPHQNSSYCDNVTVVNLSDVKAIQVIPWHFPQFDSMI